MPRYQVELLQAAENEAREAYEYLLERNPHAAEDFKFQLIEAIADLEETAYVWDADKEIKTYRMQQFPYSLMYRLRGELVTVGAVMHQHRKPGYWQDRDF